MTNENHSKKKSWKYYAAYLVVLLPIYAFFALPLAQIPLAYWPSALFFAFLATFILIGCSIGGGYDAGCIWHYHGTPECIHRPDVESMRKD
ncbi:MAG: hypothetical protein ACFFEF_02470 [Candidatus Thorarchaeota archaeon]